MSFSFSASAAEGNATDIKFSLAECYVYLPSSQTRPLVFEYSAEGTTTGSFVSTSWITNSDGDTANIALPYNSEYVVRFVFTFSDDFQPDGNIVNAFDLTINPLVGGIYPVDLFYDGSYGELRAYKDVDGVAQLVSTVKPSLINNYCWAFSSPESRDGVSISHYVLDLYCYSSTLVRSLSFAFSGVVISGGSGPEFPSYSSPDGSLINDYEQAQSDLIGSLPDGFSGGASGSNFSDVRDTITNGLSTYAGAFAAVGNFFNHIGLNFNINALLMFSLGIALVPTIVGMSINLIRSPDRSYKGRRR